jgi:hypothetical protein
MYTNSATPIGNHSRSLKRPGMPGAGVTRLTESRTSINAQRGVKELSVLEGTIVRLNH